MDGKFSVSALCNFKFKTLEDAEAHAKQATARNDQTYVIAQAVAVTKLPVPNIEIVKL